MSLRVLAAIKPITHDAAGRQLTSAEKLVLLIISDYYNDSQGCAWCGTARIATESLLSLRQLLRVLQSLEQRKLISIERRANKSNVYRFLFIPSLEHCWYCGCDLFVGDRVQDHQIPRSKGGKGGRNLVLACRSCNQAKGARTVDEYRLDFFNEEHRFFGEGDNLSCAKSVNVTPVVTSRAEKVLSMSPEQLIERLRTDKDLINLAIKESQKQKRSADEILAELRAVG